MVNWQCYWPIAVVIHTVPFCRWNSGCSRPDERWPGADHR